MNEFNQRVEKFYTDIFNIFIKHHFSFLIGGGIATRAYAPDIGRSMKDVDFFCKAGDYPKILSRLKDEGYQTTIPDERWLAKIKKNDNYADLIFSSPNYLNPVDESWFKHAHISSLFGLKINILAPEELIWCKTYIQDRSHYDGPDINHIILNQGKNLDWKRLLMRMENHWELLFNAIINFRFVYPSQRGIVPKWLLEELISRLQHQMTNPIPQDKICRGPLISRSDYQVDISEKGFRFIT